MSDVSDIANSCRLVAKKRRTDVGNRMRELRQNNVKPAQRLGTDLFCELLNVTDMEIPEGRDLCYF